MREQEWDIRSMTPEELSALALREGEKPFRAKQLFEWLHKKRVWSYAEMTNLPAAFRRRLEEDYPLESIEQVEVQTSRLDGTRKYLFRLRDGNVIESVFMRYHHGNSVCISSQAGCRMGCRFCASTLDGLARNLLPSEMLEQIYRIQEDTGERVSNVVIMGSGEPLDNYDNVLRFLRMVSDPAGLCISQRNITMSTCGLVPQMRRLAQEKLQITLALSLHAPTDEKRRELMPIARKYSLEELMDVCRYYFRETGRRITFEYSLAAGFNDSGEDAKRLGELLRGQNCHVNLIPVNPVRERNFRKPNARTAHNFKIELEKYVRNVTIRREMGSDIDGACGQLRKRYLKERKRETYMRVYSATDVGRYRKVNQDYIYASEEPVGNLPNLFVVADGMGGHNAGDYASSHAVQVLVESVKASADHNPIKVIRSGMEAANRELIRQSRESAERKGMGTTMVAATVVGSCAYVANVGDSRLYVVGDEIRQVTRDHSLVQEMVRLGELSEEDARNHPDKHIITRALGAGETVEIDFFDFKVEKNSNILMCSDGLSNMVADSEIRQVIAEKPDVHERGEELIRLANEHGGRDNIAVILIEPFAEEVKKC